MISVSPCLLFSWQVSWVSTMFREGPAVSAWAVLSGKGCWWSPQWVEDPDANRAVPISKKSWSGWSGHDFSIVIVHNYQLLWQFYAIFWYFRSNTAVLHHPKSHLSAAPEPSSFARPQEPLNRHVLHLFFKPRTSPIFRAQVWIVIVSLEKKPPTNCKFSMLPVALPNITNFWKSTTNFQWSVQHLRPATTDVQGIDDTVVADDLSHPRTASRNHQHNSCTIFMFGDRPWQTFFDFIWFRVVGIKSLHIHEKPLVYLKIGPSFLCTTRGFGIPCRRSELRIFTQSYEPLDGLAMSGSSTVCRSKLTYISRSNLW